MAWSSLSRSGRFVGGLSFGYLHSALLTVIGLWLTPYLLKNLGQTDYGLWVLGAQVLAYLGLMDLGLVALLPRDVAYATGRASDDRRDELRTLIGETASIVAWQTPVVALVGFVVWWLIPGDWSPLRWPLAIVVFAFVITFPLRIWPAALQGLQDLTFLGGAQLGAWLVGTVVTVALVQAGFGLYSLAAGWVTTQILITLAAWRRLRHRYLDAIPVHLPPFSMSFARAVLGRGMWISVSQVAQVLLNGTELFVIGKLMGPAAVVPYACTAKLVTLLANQPQLFMQTAVPALSELRAVSRERLFQVSTSMSQAMLIGSGAIACVVLAINQPFVTWWVGSDRFLGMGLTVLLALSMMLRHWNLAVGYTLFCFGRERRLAITGMADGLLTVVSMIVLIPQLGAYGAVIGSLIGICGISLPNNLRALAREEGVSLSATVKPLRSWFTRFALAACLVTVAVSAWIAEGFWAVVIIGALVGGSYFGLMVPVLSAPPLGSILVPRLRHWIASSPLGSGAWRSSRHHNVTTIAD